MLAPPTGLPLLVVLVTAGVRPQGYGTSQNCWLSRKSGVIWSYAGPVAVVLTANFAVLVFTIRTTCRLSKQTTSGVRLETARRWIRTTVIMLPLLGLTWLPGFLILDSRPASVVAAYAFCILNASQGCALFLFHCALNRSVRRVALRKLKSSQLFDRCVPAQWRRNSNGEERCSSSTVTSDSRVIATIFGKRGSASFASGEAAVHDPMAGKFTSTISSCIGNANGAY
ncbi:adhesion G protein-coupled receptor E5-like [Amblyomma americanum]